MAQTASKGVEGMASEPPRSRRRSQRQREGTNEAPGTQTDAVVDLLLRAGHTQVAAMTAASRFWSSWAQTADRYAQALGTEICDVLEGRTGSDEVSVRFADATSAYLRELTELPAEAVRHFNEQIAKEPRNKAPRTRRVRAKE
jgi:hypothetical protein